MCVCVFLNKSDEAEPLKHATAPDFCATCWLSRGTNPQTTSAVYEGKIPTLCKQNVFKYI